jgi:tetratricopeptide (TPR) repeat protein
MTEQSKYLNGELQLGNEEVDKMIQNLAKVKGRLGDFYSIKENFVEALTEYDEAIQYRKKLNRSEPDRVIASLELAMGNAYLFQGLEGAESDALTHLISAVNILTDTL